jgi:hypothetical protein
MVSHVWKFLIVLSAAILPALLPIDAVKADSLTWTFRSDHPNVVSLEFYSKTRNHVWPGDGKVYILDDSEEHTYNLGCRTGEKICYGAWVRNRSDEYWGVGYDGKEGCTGCCYTCGAGATKVFVLNP